MFLISSAKLIDQHLTCPRIVSLIAEFNNICGESNMTLLMYICLHRPQLLNKNIKWVFELIKESGKIKKSALNHTALTYLFLSPRIN